MNWNNIAVLGMAKSGIAAAYKLKELGFQPFISEIRPEKAIENAEKLKLDFACEFGSHSEKIFTYKTVIVSPGIPLQSPVILELKKRKIHLISEIEFGYQIKHPGSKIIAITGSNGKSTTVSLIHHILQTAGFHSILAGNIGTAFTSFSIEKEGIDFIVLEISSFQLDLIQDFHPNIAAVLNITPDHLNRYESFADYIQSKFKIFQNIRESDTAIINASDEVICNYAKELNIHFRYFGLNNPSEFTLFSNNYQFKNSIYTLQNSKLAGVHNLMNSMAAVMAIDDFVDDKELIQRAITSFQPLPHRLEECRTVNGITFINDSKATNTDSVKYALTSFDKPVRLILGGSDKGEDFRILNPLLKTQAKKIYLIGETQDKMTQAFHGICEIETFVTFSDCIEKAFTDSQAGDIILLSPACASYDMFINYEDRGNQFKEIVRNLK
jgi:UDP-N-acetylmuramoylalanine--D-glutamate ligase